MVHNKKTLTERGVSNTTDSFFTLAAAAPTIITLLKTTEKDSRISRPLDISLTHGPIIKVAFIGSGIIYKVSCRREAFHTGG